MFLFKLNQKSKEEGEEDERCNIFIEGNKSEKGITIYEIIKQHCKNINILALFCVIKQHFSREIGYNFKKKLLRMNTFDQDNNFDLLDVSRDRRIRSFTLRLGHPLQVIIFSSGSPNQSYKTQNIVTFQRNLFFSNKIDCFYEQNMRIC